MEIDRLLSRLTRTMNQLIPMGRRLRFLRQWCARRYSARDDRWAVIKDYRGNLKFKLDRAAYMGGLIYWHGWHHRDEINFLERVLRPDDVFLDAGANTGEFTIAVAVKVKRGRVLAFEPQSEARDVLEENVRLNVLSNVGVFPFGLAEFTARAQLYTPLEARVIDGANEGLHTQYPGQGRTRAAEEVDFLPLDEVLRSQGINRLDWMKIDVEGGELPLLMGGKETLARLRPRILIEINPPTFRTAGYAVADVARFLNTLEYRPFILVRNKLVPIDWGRIENAATNVVCWPDGLDAPRLP